MIRVPKEGRHELQFLLIIRLRIIIILCYILRIPSYCDRILFKSYDDGNSFSFSGLEYNHINSFNQSDHKPVYGLFQIKVNLLKKLFLIFFK